MKNRPPLLIELNDPDDVPKFNHAVNRFLANGWYRDIDRPTFFEPETYYLYFQRAKFDCLQGLDLYILGIRPRILSVVGIVSRRKVLTFAEYRQVLNDFRSNVLDRMVQAGFPIRIIQQPDPSDVPVALMPPKVAKVLKKFAALDNKGLSSPHPFDMDHWKSLLIALYRTKPCLQFDSLRDWLRIDDCFPKSAVTVLEREFGFAMQLLRYNDETTAFLAGTHPLCAAQDSQYPQLTHEPPPR